MKKILALFLSFLFLFTLLPSPVFAAAKGKVSITGGPETFTRGEEFFVEVELNRNPGLVSLRIDTAFDPLVLKVLEVTDLSLLPGFSYDIEEDSVILRYKKEGGGKNLITTGKLARIKFQILENAIYGDSAISPVISQELYDAQNSAGKAVAFDTSPLTLTLSCQHENPARFVITEADFETEGVAHLICPECSFVVPVAILPVLKSEDGNTEATLEVGEYQNDDKKSLTTLVLTDTPEAVKAKETFSDALLSCFKIQFTRNDEIFLPDGTCKIRLKTDLDLSGTLSLYLQEGEDSRRLEVTKEGNELLFNYHQGTYVLVSREEKEPEIPQTTATTPTDTESTPTESTKNPSDLEKKKELFLIGGGFLALILCGTAVVILLRRKDDF